MKQIAEDGLRFSFGHKHHHDRLSAKSTPKFTSIEFNDNNKLGQTKNSIRKTYTQEIQIPSSNSQLFRELGGGGIDLFPKGRKKVLRMNDRLSSLISDSNNSLDNHSHKSVKSTLSVNEKLLNRKNKLQSHPQQKEKEKKACSLANIFWSGNKSKAFSRLVHNSLQHNKITTERHFKSFEPKLSEEKEEKSSFFSQNVERKDTQKITHNFFSTNAKKLEFRETTKGGKEIEKIKQKQKSKFFKNSFYRIHPSLKINSRQLNNKKIESIAKIYVSDSNL